MPKEFILVLIMDREFCGKRFLKELMEIGGVEVLVRLRKNANLKVEKRREVSLRFTEEGLKVEIRRAGTPKSRPTLQRRWLGCNW